VTVAACDDAVTADPGASATHLARAEASARAGNLGAAVADALVADLLEPGAARDLLARLAG
jgi:hypothetical protein